MSNILEIARRIAASNPWLKWAVVILVGLFAVEFIAQRGIALWVQLGTAHATVEKANADAERATAGTSGAPGGGGLPKDFWGAPLVVPLDAKPKK